MGSGQAIYARLGDFGDRAGFIALISSHLFIAVYLHLKSRGSDRNLGQIKGVLGNIAPGQAAQQTLWTDAGLLRDAPKCRLLGLPKGIAVGVSWQTLPRLKVLEEFFAK